MRCAALVLASGLSTRFGPSDKLLAELKGKALLCYALDAVRQAKFDGYFAITPDRDPRAKLARARGFSVIDNPSPQSGLGATIARGARYLVEIGYESVCITLGDMPFVTSDYLTRLLQRSPNADIIFSEHLSKNQPPAIFRGEALGALMSLSGDIGANALDLSVFKIARLKMPEDISRDMDKPADFEV